MVVGQSNYVRLVSRSPPQIQGCTGFDACLVSDQGRFDCHKVMLAAVSPVLKHILRNSSEEEISVVCLPEYSNTEIFLLNRLLTGKMVTKSNLKRIPQLFKDLKIDFSFSYSSSASEPVKMETEVSSSGVFLESDDFDWDTGGYNDHDSDTESIKNKDSFTDGVSYPCEICSNISFSYEDHTDHMNLDHKTYDENPCQIARRKKKVTDKSRPQKSNQNFNGQNATRNQNNCHLCQMAVKSFKKHYKMKHHGCVNPMLEEYKKFLRYNNLDFVCTKCNKSFQSQQNLRIHTKTKHTEYTGTFPCNTCGREFQQMITLKKHMFRFHTNGTPSINSESEQSIICDLCAKVFDCNEDLKIHMWIHAKSFKCSMESCFEEFPRKSAYIEHMLLRHKIVIKTNKPRASNIKVQEEDQTETENEAHLCPTCGDSFRNRKALNDHTKNTHSKEFLCHICNKVCKRKVALELHIAKHGPPTIKCEQCEKLFYTNYNLRRHMITMHVDNAQKPFKCSMCPKGFESAKNLEGHLNMHNGLKPYICDLCGKGFQNASNRRAHMKKLHHVN